MKICYVRLFFFRICLFLVPLKSFVYVMEMAISDGSGLVDGTFIFIFLEV